MTLRSVLLASMAIGLIAGCGESKQPASSSPSATTPPVDTETTPPEAPVSGWFLLALLATRGTARTSHYAACCRVWYGSG